MVVSIISIYCLKLCIYVVENAYIRVCNCVYTPLKLRIYVFLSTYIRIFNSIFAHRPTIYFLFLILPNICADFFYRHLRTPLPVEPAKQAVKPLPA